MVTLDGPSSLESLRGGRHGHQHDRARQDFHLAIAEQIAPTWAKRRAEVERASAPVRRWLLAALDPAPGQTLLELAAGVGDTGFEAAEQLGPRGRLITSDFSPAMLEGCATRRATELELGNVEFRVLDAQRDRT